MTAGFRFALRGEDEDHEDERLWALCEDAEDLFADPPEPVRRRYELLGCAFEAELPSAPGFLALESLDKDGRGTGEWYLEGARVLASRPCARDLSRTDVTIEAVRCDQQPGYPQRVALSVGFRLSDGRDRPLGHFRDLAEVLPAEEPPPHPVRLLGCAVQGPLLDVLEGRTKWRKLGYRSLAALDAAGETLAWAGHPDIVDRQPSPRGPGLYDLTVHMEPQPPVVADVWALWREGRPAVPNLWARFGSEGRDHWLGPALVHRGPDRPAGATYHLDGRHVTDTEGFLCALGEAVNGPGGYFGRCLDGVADALCGGFGATRPFTLVWHHHEVARRSLGVQPLVWHPATFHDLLAFLEEERVEVVLA
ncbi:barstar family protein [Streptomyces sp. WAC07149]|uniref:barstar family protein n=1 Tax=Streptomyces sp. WAC07149 TaxID=2487425 RepID=UPI001C8DF0E4|nr:barstar family protein [Streptomyces sp. WAC07149]